MEKNTGAFLLRSAQPLPGIADKVLVVYLVIL